MTEGLWTPDCHTRVVEHLIPDLVPLCCYKHLHYSGNALVVGIFSLGRKRIKERSGAHVGKGGLGCRIPVHPKDLQ